MQEKYFELDQFISIYFGEDFDLFENTIPEIVANYIGCSTPSDREKLISQIDTFLARHPNDLSEAFDDAWIPQFSVRLWGHTARSFLDEIKDLLHP
ncbi:contact-dependent growth inhibition system immunity protein [Burkholderia latens]|uniref:contact-dependent growth inhibition system immunity protein n=1 Tax=Burkholderia latens TaxID=488446 RepID=UPI00158E605F|nr:contact-dependent growth inhibition system immunity protein [Burkholderia latens]